MWKNRSRYLFCKERCEGITHGISFLKSDVSESHIVTLKNEWFWGKEQWANEQIPNLPQTLNYEYSFIQPIYSTIWPNEFKHKMINRFKKLPPLFKGKPFYNYWTFVFSAVSLKALSLTPWQWKPWSLLLAVTFVL